MIHDPWTAAADRALARVEGETDRDAGEVLGVSFSTVHRWRELRKEGAPVPEPRGQPRRVLQRFIDTSSGGAAETREERPEDALTVDPLDEWVRDFERRVRYGVGKIPGISDYERRARMSDAIEAQIQALQMVGDPVPARLYELREMIRRGEI